MDGRRVLRALASLVLALAPAGLAAQQVERVQTVRIVGEDTSVRSPAWLGVHLLNEWAVGPDGRTFTMKVERVAEGSPAEAHGIRPGDRIVRINGRAATHEGLNRVMAGLRPGERVNLVLDRDGWTRSVVLTATRRPGDPIVVLPRDLAVRIDSTLQRLDSVRVRLSPLGMGAAGPRSVQVRRAEDGRVTAVVLDEAASASRVYGFRGADSLASRLPGILLRKGYPGTPDTAHAGFSTLVEELHRTEVAVNRHRERAAPEDRDRILRELRGGEAVLSRAQARAQAPTRPLLPFIVGQNRIAGAALTPVNEGLAAYFDVGGGLLVTEVTPGTPADEAGVTPGDVVVRVDGRPVRTLDDLRGALRGPRPGPLVLDLVRKGRPVQVALPR